MVVDSSPLLCILMPEPDAPLYARLLAHATDRVISAVTYVESAMILARFDDRLASPRLTEFLANASIRIEPFTAQQAANAADAFLRYGKGRHPAQLNFGDCMVYGLARVLNQPILCKGGDFHQTDLACLP
jgi:ribonuclease VapC